MLLPVTEGSPPRSAPRRNLSFRDREGPKRNLSFKIMKKVRGRTLGAKRSPFCHPLSVLERVYMDSNLDVVGFPSRIRAPPRGDADTRSRGASKAVLSVIVSEAKPPPYFIRRRPVTHRPNHDTEGGVGVTVGGRREVPRSGPGPLLQSRPPDTLSGPSSSSRTFALVSRTMSVEKSPDRRPPPGVVCERNYGLPRLPVSSVLDPIFPLPPPHPRPRPRETRPCGRWYRRKRYRGTQGREKGDRRGPSPKC